MITSVGLRILLIITLVGLTILPTDQVRGQPAWLQPDDDPPVLQGGEWADDFLWGSSLLSETIQTEVYWDRLILKSTEYLNWTHTWTAHFANGEFFQTEAISDTVRLAPNAPGQYFTTGMYTSTVFDAGRQVD